MKKTKTNIFFNGNPVFFKRKEGNLWEEEKRDEKGMGVSESVISEFEEYYRPNNLEVAIEHPDEIIHGVRDRMMQGPLGTRAMGILSGGNILERRVLSSLEDTARNAPRLYRQMIDEMRRAGVPGSAFNISRDMFTYDIEAGGSYQDILTTLEAEIMALGYIGPPGFTDSRGQRINLANPAQTNEFDVVAGAPGVSGNRTEVIRWHQEDLTTIRQKLEQAGMWADFSRQPGAREFLHFKFRHSLVLRTVWKEKTKLSKDKFDPQRLKSWLDDELHARALADPDYVAWFNAWPHRAAPSMAALTPAQRNELTRAQREAKERVQEQSLEARLKKILIPGEIENVTKSLETRTMLAYLFYKMSSNNEDRENVENFIDELAGVDYEGNIKTLDSVSEKVGQFIKDMGPKMEARNAKEAERTALDTATGNPPPAPTGLHLEIATLRTRIDGTTTSIGLQARLDAANSRLVSTPPLSEKDFKATKEESASLTKQIEMAESKIEAINNKIRELKKERATVNNELTTMDNEMVKELRIFGNFISEQAANTSIWGTTTNMAALNTMITAMNAPGLTQAARIAALNTFFTTPAQVLIAENVIEDTKTRKAYFEGLQKNRPNAAGKMDSRGLLYKLTKRDLELKGVTADPNLENEALLTTNILIAQARNQEIYGNVNQSIARRMETGPGVRRDEWISSQMFFSPDITGAEAIEHVCDTDSDLNKLNGLNINSTPADIIAIMQEDNMVPTVKLRELQKKLSELLRGVFVGGRRRRITDKDAPQIEKFINNLVIVESRLNAENRLQEVSEGYYDPSKSREEQVLQMLQNQTSDSVEADNRLAEDLESHDAKFKRFFLKDELAKEYNQAMDELEGLPKEEIEEELRKRGLTARVRSRGVLSLRATRFLKKAGLTLLRHNPLVWIGYDVLFKSGRWFYGYAKSIVWTPQAQERAKKIRAKYRGAIIEPVTTVAFGWPFAIGGAIMNQGKKLTRKISDWGEKKSS